MKFTVSVENLQYMLRMVKDLKLPCGPLADATCSLMRFADSKLTAIAYNGDALVRASVPVACEGEASFVVDASSLFSAVSSFQPIKVEGKGTSDVKFTLAGDYKKLSLSAKTKYANSEIPHKRNFPLYETSGFPDFSAIDSSNPTFTTKAAYLSDGVDSAAYALSGDKSNIIFTGMLFVLEPGKLWQVATNGICLAEYVVPINYDGPLIRTIVPGSLVSRLSRCFSEDEDVSITINDRHFLTKSTNLLVAGPLIREDFPDYKSMIASPANKIRIEKELFLENVLNLSYEAASIPDNRITLSVNNGFMSLRSGQSENEGLPVEGFNGAASIDCNLKMLVSSVKNLYGDYIEIGFTSSEAPLHFYSTQFLDTQATLSTLLVPLRPEIG